jgi:8-oxo-dGTP pyrophosphatase MutT (NUDIX family)
MRTIRKVTAFVLRGGSPPCDVLVFDHPHLNAGTQLPAGTVDDGETFDHAVLRETTEETGLSSIRIASRLAIMHYALSDEKTQVERHLYALTLTAPCADRWEHFAQEEGLVFSLYWLDIDRARIKLHPAQAKWLEYAIAHGLREQVAL